VIKVFGFLLIFISTIFASNAVYAEEISEATAADSISIDSLSNSIYPHIVFEKDTLKKEIFDLALTGYLKLRSENLLMKDSVLAVIDYSLSSKSKRLWVINLVLKKVVFNELVAHGKNSGGEYAYSFSNKYRSRKSSLGFMITGDIYNGKHKLSLKLNGMESGFNTNVFGRGVVIHGAHYVNDAYAEVNQRMGRSFGCPAVSRSVNKELVNYIQGGVCLFAYYPNSYYLRRSKYANGINKVSLSSVEMLLTSTVTSTSENI
jgi:hypothetical protein